jgi:hypothetical protein
MTQIPEMCKKCKKHLLRLVTRDGGLVFCSHHSDTPEFGVFVAVTPTKDGKCKIQTIYPCKAEKAKKIAEKTMIKLRKQKRQRV